MTNRNLLLVDDDHVLQTNNKKYLERRGYITRQAYTLEEARLCIVNATPGIIVLDIKLPDGNGIDFLNEVRKTSNIPVMILSALGASTDIISGLENGCDYYLTKPYDIKVFLSHLEALFRRTSVVPDTLMFGPYKLLPVSNTAYIDGKDMFLAKKEFGLLELFVQHPDTTFSAEYLYEKVWRQDFAGGYSSVKNAIYRLKKKLVDSGYTINAERGEGYRFEKE